MIPSSRGAYLAVLAAFVLGSPARATAQSTFNGSRPGDRILGAAFTVVLDSASIAASPSRTLADFLAGRVAGLNVTYATGAPGYAPELTARGSATMFGPGRPLLYIDGVLAREDRHLLGGFVDRNRPSHAWSLPTDEIAEIEVALGPASGAMLAYGAPRGAVFVRTKRGGAGAWRVSSSLEATHQAAPSEFRTRTFTTGDVTAGGTTDYCPLTDQSTGYCTASGTLTRVPFGGNSPFEASTGLRAAVGASGALRFATLRAGASYDQSPSQLAGDAFDRIDLSLAAQSRTWRTVSAAATVRYAQTDGAYAVYGEDGLMQLGLTVVQPDDTTFALESRSADVMLDRSRPYDAGRLSAGLDLQWTPRPWLTAYALGAYDNAWRNVDVTYDLYNAFPPFEPIATRRELNTYSDVSGSGTIGVRATRALRRGMRLTAEIGGHLSNVALDEEASNRTVDIGGGGSTSNETTLDPAIRNADFFTSARLQFGEHRWIAAGFRKETSKLFGEAFGDDPFNTAQASWTISREGFFPRIPGVDRVQVRAAYGESGDHEAVLGAFQYAGAIGGAPGQFSRRLQRTTEHEGGVDVDLFDDRVRVRVNAFARAIRDGYIVSASAFPAAPIALSSWMTRGHEWSISLPSRGAGPLRWDAELAWSSARTRITRLSGGGLVTTLLGGERVRFEAGAPFGSVLVVPYTWADTNDDDIVDATEITLGIPERQGVTQPTDLLAVTLKASWRDRISAGVTFDGKFGHVKTDATARFSCQILVCPDLYAGSLAEQARAVASGYTANFTGPVHAADFVRAREIWVRAALPSRLGPLAMRGATLTLAVRNAGIWSRYPGGDPETGSFVYATVQRGDYLTPALARQVSLRLDLTP